MKKIRILVSLSLFIVFFSLIGTVTAKAASGDFYNITKKQKYTRTNLVTNKELAQQLQSEMDNGDVIAKELSGGKIINYGLASSKFIQLLGSMNAQQAIMSVISSQDVIVDKTTSGIDGFGEAELLNDFDLENVY